MKSLLRARAALLALAMLASAGLVLAADDPAKPAQQPQPPAAVAPPVAPQVAEPVQQVAPLVSRDVVERLKTIRSEIILEEERVRLLKARLSRLELEREVSLAEGRASGAPDPREKAQLTPARTAPAPVARVREAEPVDEAASLLVKAITVRPFKEAIVMYRGRVYTVRPGDRLGPIEIKDINDSGVVTANGSGGGRSVLLGQ